MPNAKVLSEKQAIVASLTEKLQNAAAGVLVDYKGITVAEDTQLRSELRKNNVEYAVVKNTLLRFAVDSCGMNELDSLLSGTTSLAICHDDPVARAPGPGPGHHAGPHFRPGLRAQADRREAGRSRRGARRR